VEMDKPLRELEPAGWYAVSAWHPTHEAAARLADLLLAARDNVPAPATIQRDR